MVPQCLLVDLLLYLLSLTLLFCKYSRISGLYISPIRLELCLWSSAWVLFFSPFISWGKVLGHKCTRQMRVDHRWFNTDAFITGVRSAKTLFEVHILESFAIFLYFLHLFFLIRRLLVYFVLTFVNGVNYDTRSFVVVCMWLSTICWREFTWSTSWTHFFCNWLFINMRVFLWGFVLLHWSENLSIV